MKSRVKDVRKMRFNKGLFPARPPFGYKSIKIDKKVIGFKIHKKEAKIVSECFKMTLEGYSYSYICKNLKLKPQSYYNIIKNKVYCGYIKFEGEERKGTHDIIISEEVYNKINNSLTL